MEHRLGSFYSWTIVDNNVAVKKCDKTVFEQNNSCIPTEIRWYFGLEKIKDKYKRNIDLIYNGNTFSGYVLYQKSSKSSGTYIGWGKDLEAQFSGMYPKENQDFPNLVFKRIEDNKYEVYFEEEQSREMSDLLRNFVERFINEYPTEKKKSFTNNELGNYIRHDVKKIIYHISIINEEEYKVKGSVGQSQWADVPWVAIFNKKVTTTAKKGKYIVYLLARDQKTLYLTFNQGCTEVKDKYEKKERKGILKSEVANIRNSIDSRGFSTDDIDLHVSNTIDAKLYEYGCVFSKAYTIDNLPDEKELRDDLRKMVEIYEDYIALTSNDFWTPSLEEYDPGISKDQWLTLLNGDTIFGPVWLRTLAYFYANKEGATCTDIAAQYGSTAQSINATCTQIAKRVYKETNCPLHKSENGEKEEYWSILFQGKYVDSKEHGMFAWRLRKELYEALEEFDILRFLVEKPMDINTKDALTKITEYIAARGFTYSGNLIENFYLSLKSKPFVILAGTSGTGKTRLVKLFAEAIGAEYKLVPVRPDWSDGSDLFGHYDLNGNFVEGPVCECFAFANANPNKPVILCLDEMNLARVEYYLSDFLSVIESREKYADGSVYTTPIAQFEEGIPNNLYIVGTVNMDETTFPFSKKVLDRANTIEFSYVELTPAFEAADSAPEPLVLANDFLKTEYLVLGRDCADEQEFVTDICSTLQEINEILKKANAHVGYRVRDEIVFYMLNNKKAGNLLSDDEAMDNEIMQKILPRIQGSSSAIRSLLIDLYNFCSKKEPKLDENTIDVASGMKKNAASAKYPKSAEKIGYMMTRFEDDGFTSYWL